jgi:Fe-S oxidoreductase
MARMKTEFLYQYAKSHGRSLHDRLVGYLPRYAPWASRLSFLANLRDRIPGAAMAGERLTGFSARRRLPRWRRDAFRSEASVVGSENGREIVLLADTFNTYFEPENLEAALSVLQAAGYRVHLPRPVGGGRPLCCGRTFLSVGMVDEARAEACRTLDALRPFVERGLPVVGLEPSCLLTLRDEFGVLLPGAETSALERRALLFEEFLAGEHEAGRLELRLQPIRPTRVLLHGHCHQKAFGVMAGVETVLRLVPELEVKTVASSCCGMAGAFGYGADTYDVSMKMAELSLLPAVRATGDDTLVVADGTSCRHQIHDGTGRAPVHVARVLCEALAHRQD